MADPRVGNETLAAFPARHVILHVDTGIAEITLNRPERKNPLTFDSYRELVAIFRSARDAPDVKAFILAGADGNFSSGGDVHEIIAPLIEMKTAALLDFTRLTGDLVKAMRACPQPIVAAVDGICVGAGAILAMASDIRLGTAEAKVAFLFNRVGLAGCDMGACAILPRMIGQGRASELLFTGRVLGAEEGERWGFFNRLVTSDGLRDAARELARSFVEGPNFAQAMTKRMLHMEWSMSVDDAIEAEAIAQALCMRTEDFTRAYQAFSEKRKPEFRGD